jgi:hypothetical protein
VLYYNLPELKKTDEISLEIKDSAGNIVRTYYSKPEKIGGWAGGPQNDSALSKSKGLNRFVWDMRYATMPGVSGVYIEANYSGHKAIPGKYTVTLNAGGQKISTNAEILANPIYPTTAQTYAEYHQTMSAMEAEVTTMHKLVNDLFAKRKRLESLLASLPTDGKYETVKKNGEALVKKMKTWDEDMVQRNSKAYDDVENFPNKFTADYMYLINQTESDIPRVNQPNLDLMKEMNAKGATLKARGNEILEKDIPTLNRELWEAGKGAIWE